MELFAHFDTGGYRRPSERTRKDPASAKRTEGRRANATHNKHKKKQKEMVETRPNLAEEINVFKRIAQHVARQDMAKEQAVMFRVEDKQHYKGLNNLGLLGHQAAIQANCEIDPVTQ